MTWCSGLRTSFEPTDGCTWTPQGSLPSRSSVTPASWGERWSAFRKSAWGLMLIVVVMGGIYSGKFTPTEAAAMAAVYAFVIAVFVYQDLKLSQVPKVLLDSASLSAGFNGVQTGPGAIALTRMP